MRRAFVAVLLAALVLLSGCSLLGGGGTPTSDASPGSPTATPAGTPTPTGTATPTPSPTATPTPPPRPEGYGSSDVTNATTARVEHTDGLLARSNFTLAYVATVRTPNGTASISLLQGVDTAGDGPRVVADTVLGATGDRGNGSRRRTRYYANGTEYIRVAGAGGNVSYGTVNRTLPGSTCVGLQYVSPAATNVSYERGERFTRNGTTYVRYHAEEIDDPGALLSSRVRNGSVTGGNVTLVVDSAGVVRSIDYRATVERDGRAIRYRVQFGVSRLDGTTVRRPDWAQRG
jgi:hypothetical protein